MQLVSITLSDLRRFTRPTRIDGLGAGVNVLSAPNEDGKSTLFDALQALFFQKHTARGKEITALRPHAGGAPCVSVELDLPEGRFRVTKRWLSRALAEVHQGARLIAKADEAEAWLARLTQADDGGPAGLLWVRQGLVALDQGERREKDTALKARRDLLVSVAGEIEAVTGGRRMERALRRTGEELDKLLTGTGRPKAGGPLKEALDEAETLLVQRQDLAQRAETLRAALEERRGHRRSLERLRDPDACAERARRLDIARAAWDAARTHDGQRAQAEDRARHLQQAQDAAQDRLDRFEAAQAALTLAATQARTAAEAEQPAAQRAQDARQTGTAARATLDQARLDQEQAQAGLAAAHRADRIRRETERHAALTDLLVRARSHQDSLTTAARAARQAPDDETLAQLTQAQADLHLQRELALRAAPQLELSYLPGAPAVIGPDGPLTDGVATPIPQDTRFDLPGLGRMTLRPGTGAEAAADGLAQAQSALNAALTRAGFSDFEAARAAHATGRAARATLAEARAALDALAPAGVAALEAELAALPVPGPALSDDPAPDLVVAQGRAEVTATALKSAELAHDRASQALENALADLARAQSARQAADLQLATAQADSLRLGPVDTVRTELCAALATARDAHQAAQAHLSDLIAAAPDLEAAQAALKRAQDVLDGAAAEDRRLDRRLAELGTLIDLHAGAGVEEELAAAEERLGRLQGRADRLWAEAHALTRLRDALETARAAAREQHFRPITAELAPMLRLLWPGAELRWDADSALPTHLIRDGQEEDLSVLSGGTREQIALLVRLAFARLLARAGRAAPVILDDALVYTDDDRIERMFDALHRQAGDLQILVLSCRQRAFRDLGGTVLRFAPGELPDELG